MADKRITDLPPAGSPLEGNVYPVVQGTSTVKQTLVQLRAAIGAVVASMVGLPSAPNKIAYYTAANVLDLTDFTPAARALLDDTSATTMQNTLNADAAVTVASATTTAIGTAASPFVSISGTSTITGFGNVAAGITKELTFTGALTLTHNATSLILPGAANITTAAGDHAKAISMGGGNWSVYSYTRASGKPIAFAYDRGNILGTVSQASGVPTGAVVEAGSGANGEYVKFADGRMICTFNIASVSLAVNTAYAGGVYYGLPAAWTFPAAFVGNWPSVTLTPYTNGKLAWATRGGAASLTTAQMAVLDMNSTAAVAYQLSYTAIGRWFE